MSLGQIPYVSQLRFFFFLYEVETIKPTTQHVGECQVFEYRLCKVSIHRRCSINIQVPVHFHGALLRCYNAVEGAEDEAANIWVFVLFSKSKERCR